MNARSPRILCLLARTFLPLQQSIPLLFLSRYLYFQVVSPIPYKMLSL